MTVGLPGAGIGGLFYLLAAVVMPVRELALTARGRSSARRWGVVGRQFAHALGIAAGTWATGWLIVAGAARIAGGGTIGQTVAGGAPMRMIDLLRPAQGVATLATLAAVIAALALLGRLFARPATQHAPRVPAGKAAAPIAMERPTVRHASLTPRTTHSLTPSASHPAWRDRGARRTRGSGR